MRATIIYRGRSYVQAIIVYRRVNVSDSKQIPFGMTYNGPKARYTHKST